MLIKIKKNLRQASAFTMVELLVTMLLLTIVLLGLATLQIRTIRQVTSARRAQDAARLAQNVVEKYRLAEFAALAVTAPNWVDERMPSGGAMKDVAVDGVSQGPFSVQSMVEGIAGGRLITVRVSWLDIVESEGADPEEKYRTLNVTMTTMRFQ